jgi:hypothetical protein
MGSPVDDKLKDEKKNAIRHEEIYRQEVRKELASKEQSPTRSQKIWKVFNTPLILLVLSSVVIGGVSTWIQYRLGEEKDAELRARERLTMRNQAVEEIKQRAVDAKEILDYAEPDEDATGPFKCSIFNDAYLELMKGHIREGSGRGRHLSIWLGRIETGEAQLISDEIVKLRKFKTTCHEQKEIPGGRDGYVDALLEARNSLDNIQVVAKSQYMKPD